MIAQCMGIINLMAYESCINSVITMLDNLIYTYRISDGYILKICIIITLQ